MVPAVSTLAPFSGPIGVCRFQVFKPGELRPMAPLPPPFPPILTTPVLVFSDTAMFAKARLEVTPVSVIEQLPAGRAKTPVDGVVILLVSAVAVRVNAVFTFWPPPLACK
jgi:hypothetical protein